MEEKPTSNNLTQIFGIAPKEEVLPPAKIDNFPTDFEKARGNLIETMDRMKGIIAEAVELAHVSQHPRFYEVLGVLFRADMDASRALVTMHREAKAVEQQIEQPTQGKTVIHNNTLVATTAEVLSLFKKAVEDKEIK